MNNEINQIKDIIKTFKEESSSGHEKEDDLVLKLLYGFLSSKKLTESIYKNNEKKRSGN